MTTINDDLREIRRVMNAVRFLQRRIESDMEHRARLERLAMGVPGMRYDREIVHGGEERSALEDAACAMADYDAKIAGDIKRLTDALSFVMGIIDAVRDQRYSMVLTRYYRDGWTLEKIAVELGYTWRHVNRMHAIALKEANVIYQAQKEKDVIECHSLDVI